MDIMRPRVWRACGWAATALSGGIALLTAKILHDGHGLAGDATPILNIMIAACVLLAGIRVFAPSMAKTRQMVELNLTLQRQVLGTMTPPTLTLVPPLASDRSQPEAPTQELPRVVNLR